ncbi:hypothetical protein [Ensifer soli]|uniref:hypothetical protein n=1 Tax=Ciceribacter sp. sgz301302 TaxID=3342379 RepID=UPI0035B823A5
MPSIAKRWHGIDDPERIFILVTHSGRERQAIVRTDESSDFSGLYVDGNTFPMMVDPTLWAAEMEPRHTCCTHIFNGKIFGRKDRPPSDKAPADDRNDA